MTIKKFMMVNRKAPYGTVYALESLEVVLIAAAFEQEPGAVKNLVTREARERLGHRGDDPERADHQDEQDDGADDQQRLGIALAQRCVAARRAQQRDGFAAVENHGRRLRGQQTVILQIGEDSRLFRRCAAFQSSDDPQPARMLAFDFVAPPGLTPGNANHYYELPRNLIDLNPTSTRATPLPRYLDHTATDIFIGASGPGAGLFGQVMDNTEVFFRMLRAVGYR